MISGQINSIICSLQDNLLTKEQVYIVDMLVRLFVDQNKAFEELAEVKVQVRRLQKATEDFLNASKT